MTKFLKRPIVIISFVILAGGIIGGYTYFGGDDTPTYDSVIAEKRDLIQKVSVTGRVKPAKSVNLAFEKAGTVALLLVEIGQKVGEGQLLAQLDIQDAQKEIRDAGVDLEAAKLDLDKIKLEQQQQLRGDTLNKSYEDGMVTLADLYGKFDAVLDDIDNILFDDDLFDDDLSDRGNNITYYANYFLPYYQKNSPIPSSSEKLFSEIEKSYQLAIADFQTAKRGSNDAARSQAINKGYELAVKTAQLIKLSQDTIRPLQDRFGSSDSSTHSKQDIFDAHTSTLTIDGSTIDTHLKNLLATINTINSQRDTIENQPLDLHSQELTIKQRENNLRDAIDNLGKYSIRAPISGTVTKQDAKAGEIVSANTPLVSLISASQFEIEANIPEADIAKVKIGNTAKVTLDAYGNDASFDVKITAIDPAETVVDGVATYKTTFQFIDRDERVKSGMTANIDISTEKREGVIVIPQRAVATQNGDKIVRILNSETPKEVKVKTGLRGSDGNIEIIEGVNEGDTVIIFFE